VELGRNGAGSSFALSLLSILIVIAACSGPVRLPEDPIEDPLVLLTALRTRARPDTLYLYARAEYYSDHGVRKGKLLFMAGAPDRIRVETLSPTDDMLSLLASQGEEFVAFQRGGKRCVVGTPCLENTSRFLPIPLSIPQLIGLLSGQPPVIAHVAPALTLRRKTGLYELRLEDPVSGTTQLLEVDPFELDVISTTIRQKASGLRVRLNFDEYRAQGPYRLPRKIRVRLDQDDTDLSLEVREVEADLVFKGDPFTVLCPRGTAVERYLCPDEQPGPEEGETDD